PALVPERGVGTAQRGHQRRRGGRVGGGRAADRVAGGEFGVAELLSADGPARLRLRRPLVVVLPGSPRRASVRECRGSGVYRGGPRRGGTGPRGAGGMAGGAAEPQRAAPHAQL